MMERILFISPLPPPHYGAAMVSETCLDILKRSNNFSVESIKLNYSKKMDDIGHINFSKIVGLFKVRSEIVKKIKSFKPDLIYFAPATNSFGLIREWFLSKKIKISKIPVLLHIHSRMFNKPFNNFFYKRIFCGNKAIILGKELISDIDKYIPKRNLFLLPNAIKNEISDEYLNKILIQRRKKKIPNILFLSNMDETKGWLKLLKSCKILKSKGINFNCNFVGEFPGIHQKNKFDSFLERNKLNKNVFYLGKKTGKEKNKIYINSDVFVFPTEYKLETFGMVIIEAMMFGLPVIANGIATIPSIISDNKTGFILKENSPEEIALYLEELLHNKKLCDKMGIEGRKIFKNKFEIEGYSDKFIKIIDSKN